MQTFKKKQIALAVGASLMVMAGAAQATAPAAFGARALKPVLATPASQLNANALYAATGFTGTLPVVFNITAPADTAVAGQFAVVSNIALTVNAANTAATTVGASVATDDIVVYAGTAGATQINLVVPAAGQTFTGNLATASAVTVAFSITTAGNEALRLNPTSGALEYTTDKTAATIAWLPVSVGVQAVTGDEIVATDSSGAPNTTNVTPSAQSAFNTVAPAGTAKTRSAAGSSLVDGVVIDTVTPLTAAIVVGSATTGLNFTSNVAACSPSLTDVNNAADIAAVAPTAPATGLTTAIAGSLNTITFAGATTDWTTGDVTVDAAAYVSNCFNPGIAPGSLPFTLAVTATAANLPTYALVYKADGTNQVLTALPATITDGAAPAFISATATSIGNLILTYSEPLVGFGGADELREVAENVLLGGDSIAALNLNADGALADVVAGTATNQGTLTISGLQTTDLAKQVSVLKGLSVAEQNDAGFSVTADILDPLGGVSTAAAEFLPAVAATTITAAPVTIAVGPDTTASAATTVADPTKVGSVILKFAAGKEVVLNTGKTLADLALDLVVTVNGLAGQTPVSFKVYPTAADLVLSADGSTLTIDLPTDLIYQNISAATTMDVAYAVTNVADVLIDKNVATEVVIVAAGNENVVLPLSATATFDALSTMSISGTLTGASNGSRVHAHLAKWVNTPVTDVASVTITSGKISNPLDKVATDLAINFADTVTLEAAITTALNTAKAAAAAVPGVSVATAAVKAAPFPVYVKLIRSNDVTAANSTDYLEASAILALTMAEFDDTANGEDTAVARDDDNTSADIYDPTYQVMLDPNTGAISGKLTGSITYKKTAGTVTARGLNNYGSVAQGLVDANGKFNLIAGTDPTTAEIAAALPADLFLILVHEDQQNTRSYTQLTSANPGASNYLAYVPDLRRAGTRVVLGVAPGVAGTATGTAVNIDLAKYWVDNLAVSTSWALMPVGTVSGLKAVDVPRSFVGVDSSTGVPHSYWTNDAGATDMALALAGNKVGLATELGTGDTLSTITSANFVSGAAALAFANSGAAANQTLTFAQAATITAKVPAGWSLVTVPAAGLNATTVSAVLRVGYGVTTTTWYAADGAMPAFAAGEVVFVYSKLGGAL